MAVGVGTLVAVAGLAACGTAPGSSVHGLHGGTASKTSKATTTSASPTSTSTTKAPPPTASPSSTTGLRDGPGPQSTYVVEPQPAPGSCHYTFAGSDPLPDPHCTPGALNPQVTQGTIGSTICRSGYSSSIRPPESITEAEKRGSASAYGYTGPFSTGEYDHLVSLELGGDPNDPANLWVEPNDKPGATTTANSKDVLENRLHGLVCAGQLPLATAQDAIASNWVTAYQQYGGRHRRRPLPPPPPRLRRRLRPPRLPPAATPPLRAATVIGLVSSARTLITASRVWRGTARRSRARTTTGGGGSRADAGRRVVLKMPPAAQVGFHSLCNTEQCPGGGKRSGHSRRIGSSPPTAGSSPTATPRSPERPAVAS